jgi:hypothetical protein
MLVALLVMRAMGPHEAFADGGNAASQAQTNLVNQANAPISSVFQIRLQDAYAPAFQGGLHGQGNAFSIAITMPLPEYRLLPLPQLSLLTIPVAATLPLPNGDLTAFGDVRFVDLGVLDAGHRLLFGVGPTFVFPTANTRKTGQGKWQAGPAAAAAFTPEKWLFGVLAQNPISFAGDDTRASINEMVLQPFISYQVGKGWYVRVGATIYIRLGDGQTVFAARSWRRPGLQNRSTDRQLFRGAGLERFTRWSCSQLYDHIWIIAAVS